MKKLFALVVGFALFIPSVALASEMRANANINQNETIAENVYVAGGNPVIAGTVQGDLLATGGNVYVSGTIFQDAMLAGGTINITGHVAGDLRIFAGNVMLDGAVDGELLAFGGNVTIGPHAVIRGDVNIAGGQVQVDPAAKMLGAKINIKNGEKEEKEAPRPFMTDTNKFLTTAFWVTQILLLAGIFLIVAIAHLLFPNFTKKFVQESSPKMFWRSFLLGLVIFVVAPIAAVICFMTGIGVILGFLILIAYAAFVVTSVLFGGVVFGGLMYELIKKPKKYNMGWGWLIGGVVVLHVITWVPIVGWVIGFVFFLTAWGAIASVHWNQMKAIK